VIIFGVSGEEKTVISELVAQELSWWFYDADDFHAPAIPIRSRRFELAIGRVGPIGSRIRINSESFRERAAEQEGQRSAIRQPG